MREFSNYSCVLLLVVLGLSAGSCYGFGTFGFDIHHRYSDPVKQILAVDELPAKGSPEYYSAMVHRDKIIKGRRLATANDQTPVTFLDGNETYRLDDLGFLHYANVSIGTPAVSFLVALDTGSDLFWLPCDCSKCVRGLKTSDNQMIEFNIYSLNSSNTSSKVPCSSALCEQQKQCSSPQSNCPYEVLYLSNGTSSTGVLVEDVLHLTTDEDKTKAVEAKITFGCGQTQTGSFLNGAAPNGLFGLGMDNVSVPSILANENLASNSFSMCFGPDGVGRITFGDRGSSDQGETPFNLRQSHPTYNVSITQVNVGGNTADLDFNAIFDSGTSFTYLNDPAYTLISENFNNLAIEKRHTSNSSGLPFEYCYDLSANQTNFKYPIVNLTMKGGDYFFVNDPIIVISLQGGDVYCLGIVKSDNVNIIGQNFMTGYRIVFDRERMVLGWKASDCYDIEASNTLPVNPPTAVPPAIAVNPEATSGNANNTNISGASPSITTKAVPQPQDSEVSLVADAFTHFKHLLLPITDRNPYLSEGTRQAAATTAALAKNYGADITVVDEKQKEELPEHGTQLSSIRWHLSQGGFKEFKLLERLGEGSKATAIIAEVADDLNLDLVVMSMEAIRSKHVDANLLVEFIPCPVLFLPL
ncbi:hypothetical protein GOBAR_AA10319 [Gossypium barbadense]|uniref:Peptidase A1 domain-containing protein n=1 Tax=Gossypium barbadense TaxID=3634 RepID=A0A2P5Y3Z5_GOSBA|nr:hypothetical protein GOBAR_AA10319 [Gossypium barbadense]